MAIHERSRLLLAAWVVLAACRAPSPDRPLPGKTPVEVGYSALRISLPVFVAKHHGMFERHGLNVTLRRYETAQPLVEEVLDCRVNAGGYAAFPIIFAAAARDGSVVRVATALQEDQQHPVSYLLRRAGDETLTALPGLKGKRVGILPTTAYTHWLTVVLKAAGMEAADVTVVPVAPPLQLTMLAQGGVDVLFTNDPMATAALAKGVARPLDLPAPVPRALGRSLNFGTFMLCARFVTQQPAAARALVAALDDAIAFITANQQGARATMAGYVRPEEQEFLDRYPDALFLSSGAFTQNQLAAEVMSARQLGILERNVDVGGWVLEAPRVTE